MKTYKIEDIELEEKKVHTNSDIYKLCIDKDVFFCGKKMHQEIYRKLIEQLKTLQVPINCDELKFLLK